MIGEAMLALGNAELVGAEDTLSLRKLKRKERKNRHEMVQYLTALLSVGSKNRQKRKRICYILLRFASIDATEK